MQTVDTFCLSSFLAFRYVVRPDAEWLPGIAPDFPVVDEKGLVAVQTADEILEALQNAVRNRSDLQQCGIFLSGGIDSAILAALLPTGTRAYTINFDAVSGAREVDFATKYAAAYQLDHVIVNVSWADYLCFEELLMRRKKAPLHAVEVALYCAAQQAARDGLRAVFVGNGADTTFGGMDKLLSKDWTFDEFVDRYTFVDPVAVLAAPCDVRAVFEPYRRGNMIDFVGFLKEVHGLGIIQAFGNSVGAAGIDLVEPFEGLKLRGYLDLNRIRAGEPKHQLVEIFKRLYPQLEAPRKVPFARPMDEWLDGYPGPDASCFRKGIDMGNFSGDQKYLIRGLDLFLSQLEKCDICR